MSIDEEIAKMSKSLQEAAKKAKEDPEFARQLLINAGIFDEQGNLLPPYNGDDTNVGHYRSKEYYEKNVFNF